MNFQYILIFGMVTTAILFFMTLVVFNPKLVALKHFNSAFSKQHKTLALCLFSGLFLNFFTAYTAPYFIADLAADMQRILRPYTEPFSWDMGATSVGWLLYILHDSHSGSDSWWVMSRAIEFIRQNPDGNIYQTVFFEQGFKFQYPTTSLLFVDFLQRLTHLKWGIIFFALNLLSYASLPMLAWGFYKLYYTSKLDLGSIKKSSIKDEMVGITLTLLCMLIFYPIIFSAYLGQIQTLIVLLATLSFLAFSQKKYWLTGILLGICITIKPQWVLILAWAALRKQWKIVLGGVAVAGVLSVIAMLVYGVHNFFDYLSILSYLSKHGESYYYNQSMNGLMHRFLMNGINTEFNPLSFPPYQPIVYWVSTICNAVMILFAMFWRRKEQPTLIDLCIIVLTLTMASPIAWNHHYAILIPIFAIIFPMIITQNVFGKWSIAFVISIWLLSSQNFEVFTNPLSHSHWNVFQSILFFCGIVILLTLIKLAKYPKNKMMTE